MELFYLKFSLVSSNVFLVPLSLFPLLCLDVEVSAKAIFNIWLLHSLA